MKRNEQRLEDTWCLDELFKTSSDFELNIKKAVDISDELLEYKGRLSGEETILEFLKKNDDLGILLEKLSLYSFLYLSEDGSCDEANKLSSLFTNITAQISAKLSFAIPEILRLDNKILREFANKEEFKPYRVMLLKILRNKSHVLSQSKERMLSLQSTFSHSFSDGFDALVDVDFRFGRINGEKLTNSSFSLFLRNSDIDIRKEAYFRYYSEFNKHKHVLSELYKGAVNQYVYSSRVRRFSSSIRHALFSDKVPLSVYANLIDAAHSSFDLLHRFYEIKRKKLGLSKLSHYDVYVPLIRKIEKKTTYDEACTTICNALSVLGHEYVDILYSGITTDRWVDRYENSGKSSGAFSASYYKGKPYILMNYKENSFDDIFTLAHEAGHSMHSFYSANNNYFSCYDYSIFEAEVASTFNEAILSSYLVDNADNDDEKLYVLCHEADSIVATFFRQTMFAEFEYLIFKMADKNEPLTLDIITSTYFSLLRMYFGDDVRLFRKSALESLRIPHFYRPFYVYKYATGITAALILSEKVLKGNEEDRDKYLNFLKNGGSSYPLENLSRAGADLKNPLVFDIVREKFKNLLDEIEKLI